jgi:NAD(P)H-flavin reductase
MKEGYIKKEAVREAEIVENIPVAPRIFRLTLRAPDIVASARPGQFLNLYLNDHAMLLPRPISISDAEGDCVALVYATVGKGTESLSGCEKGTRVRLLGPNGNGYDLDRVGKHVVLIGGGLGIPPLLFAARRIREKMGVKVTAILGYRDEPYYSREMRAFCEAVYEISERAAPRGTASGYTVSEHAVPSVAASEFAPLKYVAAERAIHECTASSIPASECAASECAPLEYAAAERTIHERTASSIPASEYATSEHAARVSALDEHVRGDDVLKTTGNVMDLLSALTSQDRLDLTDATVLACGPMPMLRAVAQWTRAKNIPTQVSMEERMGCGYGVCIGCTCAVKIIGENIDERNEQSNENTGMVSRRKVCTDGPVFRSEEIIWEE